MEEMVLLFVGFQCTFAFQVFSVSCVSCTEGVMGSIVLDWDATYW